MKKTGLLIAIVLGLTILSGCGRDSTFYSSGLKSEGAIKNDLEQSDVFWGMVAPAAPGDYHLTDVSVLARFTDEEKEDVVSVSVTAQSSVATYTGVFTASYEYVEGQGFVLARIFPRGQWFLFRYKASRRFICIRCLGHGNVRGQRHFAGNKCGRNVIR